MDLAFEGVSTIIAFSMYFSIVFSLFGIFELILVC